MMTTDIDIKSSETHLIERKDCPGCKESRSKLVSPQGNFRRCLSCDLLYRYKAQVVVPKIGWDEQYYKRPEILQLHEERKSLFDYLVRLGGRVSRDSIWLDVGCGIGILLSKASKAGWQVSGTDPSEVALQHAKKGVSQANLFCITSVLQLPEIEMFDVVSIIDVLRCIENPVEELEAVYRRLKPGGMVIIREANSLWFSFSKKDQDDRVKIEVAEYLQVWNAKSLKKMLVDIGYDNVVVKTSPIFTEKASTRRCAITTMTIKFIWNIFDYITFRMFSSKCFGPNLIAIGRKSGKTS